MPVDNFIPQLWSAKILEVVEKNLVYGGLANRDYEGEIRQAGDTVRINEVGDITISDYVKNSTTVTPQELTDAQRVLRIDQAKYFSFRLDDVDKTQANADIVGAATRNAGYGIRDAIDAYIAGLYTDAAISGANSVAGIGTEASPVAVNSTNALVLLSKLARLLDDNNVPMEGRWCVVPPWYKEDLSIKQVTLTGIDNTALKERGLIGNWYGLNVYVSTNYKWTTNNATKCKILAGTNDAITLAVQKQLQVEAFRPEGSFSDAIKGLTLYGAKVVRPKQLAVLIASEAAEAS
jgi:hypothetical protein